MLNKILAGLVCFSLFSTMAIADNRHYRDERHRDNNSRSHRGAWIAGAAVVGGFIGYAIANDKAVSENRSSIKKYCENRIPERYSYSKRLSKQWVKGCIQRTEEELDSRAEEAYNDGYTNERP
jgi:hypothetical protein